MYFCTFLYFSALFYHENHYHNNNHNHVNHNNIELILNKYATSNLSTVPLQNWAIDRKNRYKLHRYHKYVNKRK